MEVVEGPLPTGKVPGLTSREVPPPPGNRRWDRKHHYLIFHAGQMGPGPPTPHSITVWTKATWGPPIREHRQSMKGIGSIYGREHVGV